MEQASARLPAASIDPGSCSAEPAPLKASVQVDPRAAFLSGPIVPPLLKLALPILVVLAVQTLVGVAETYFVSALGTSALAGVSLVFPAVMLMTMMSNGGIGGGVSSAIARALGAGRSEDADALVLHSLVVAVGFGLLFCGVLIGTGHALYGGLGGSGEVLSNALVYSDLVFGASVLIWVVNLLAAALRGAGNVVVPAAMTALGALMTLILSPLLIFGWGPIPGFGVAGAGIAMIVYYGVATVAMVAYMVSRRSPVRLRAAPLQWRHFRSILGVGLLSAVGTLSSNVTVMIAVGFVGGFGTSAIAGYGIGSRPDYLLIPLLFALGTASVTLVGMNIGAGQAQRARQIAWIGSGLSAIGCGVIGAALFAAPQLWAGMFSRQADVIAAADSYLRITAPMYALYGAGIALYFASQGAGRMAWPIIAGLSRLGFILATGWYWVSVHHGGLTGLFVLFASSYVVFGAINLIAFASGASWKRPST